MRYGEISPAAPVISDDQKKKNETDLKNLLDLSGAGVTGKLPTNPSQLKCLKYGLFYDTVGNCYSTCATPDSDLVGNCRIGPGTQVKLSDGFTTRDGFEQRNNFQNIQANGTYEFNDYSTV